MPLRDTFSDVLRFRRSYHLSLVASFTDASTKFSDKSTSTNPKLSRQIPQVLTDNSCNQVSPLAKGQGTY